MEKQHLFIALGVILLGMVFGISQYFLALQTEEVSAVTVGTPNPGHAWSQMECSSDTLCVDTANKRLGIGTNTPTSALDVKGSITVSEDVCITGGGCLSSLKAAIASTALINGLHSSGNCNDAGGTVVASGQIGDQCRFNAATCPTGWTRFRLWSTTAAPTVTHEQYTAGLGAKSGTCAGSTGTGTQAVDRTALAPATVTGASHSWADLALEGASSVGWGSYDTTPLPCVTSNGGCTMGLGTVYTISTGDMGCYGTQLGSCRPPGYSGTWPACDGSTYYGYFWPSGVGIRYISGTISSTAVITQIGCY